MLDLLFFGGVALSLAGLAMVAVAVVLAGLGMV